MNKKISAVIYAYNQEKNIERILKSASFADEILVCDLNSEDQTAKIARTKGARVISHKNLGFVEPVRNFAIEAAAGDWILVLDADEEVSQDLASELRRITVSEEADYVLIPRKNIIFGSWIKNSMWWPDYHVRFFKKGKVIWKNEIHSKPQAEGKELVLAAEENLALIHHHYTSVSEFVSRLNFYTDIQAKELYESGYRFKWQDLISKPLDEFLSRYFANRGYQDGLHGLALSLLQSFSFLVLYLKIWEKEKFISEDLKTESVKAEFKKGEEQLNYWVNQANLSSNPLVKTIQKLRNKVF